MLFFLPCYVGHQTVATFPQHLELDSKDQTAPHYRFPTKKLSQKILYHSLPVFQKFDARYVELHLQVDPIEK